MMLSLFPSKNRGDVHACLSIFAQLPIAASTLAKRETSTKKWWYCFAQPPIHVLWHVITKLYCTLENWNRGRNTSYTFSYCVQCSSSYVLLKNQLQFKSMLLKSQQEICKNTNENVKNLTYRLRCASIVHRLAFCATSKRTKSIGC